MSSFKISNVSFMFLNCPQSKYGLLLVANNGGGVIQNIPLLGFKLDGLANLQQQDGQY